MFNPLDYKISELNPLKPKKGRVLISEPFLHDPYFKRAVVLLVEHNEKGSMGFILNKNLDIEINDTQLNLSGYASDLYFGGPVQPQDLFYIHTLGKRLEGSVPIGDGLYWGGDFEMLQFLLKDQIVEPHEIKFFIGYSGWEADQLESEMEQDSWLVAEMEADDIMSDDIDNMWKQVLRKMGKKISILADFPEDPSLN